MSSPSANGSSDANSPQGQMQGNQYSQQFIDGAMRKNFTYIYAILITLLVLLIVAFFVILYVYIRRRRRHIQRRLLRTTTTAEEDSSNDVNRRKKHKNHGKKPKLASAWIGDGPLPLSLSTEALLEVIQPFSLAKADEKTLLHECVAKDAEVTLMKAVSSHSTTSLAIQDEKVTSNLDAQRPQMHDIQFLNAGFLIAMPVPRSNTTASLRLRGLSNSPSSLSLAHSSSEGSCDSDDISLAESRWTDHLCHGELPELTLGISTISMLRSSTMTTAS